MWVSIGSEAACSAALRQALDNYGVFDTDALQAVLETDATGFARALCTSLQQTEAPSVSSTGTMADADVPMVEACMQTCLTGDAVDISTAEAMILEALSMLDEAIERERAAEERARSWEDRAELAATLLRAAEARTDRAQAERQAAESLTSAERAARQVAEKLLAAEAALADAAEMRFVYECRARRQAEAQRDIWQAVAGGRGEIGRAHV